MITFATLATVMNPIRQPSTLLGGDRPGYKAWFVTDAVPLGAPDVMERGWRDGFLLVEGLVWPKDASDARVRSRMGPIMHTLLPMLFHPSLFEARSVLPADDRARLHRLPMVVDVVSGLYAPPWLHLTARLLSTAHDARRLASLSAGTAGRPTVGAVQVVDALLDDPDLRGALLTMARMKVPLLELLANVEARVLGTG